MDTSVVVAFAFGLAFLLALIILAIRFPNPTPFQYGTFRVILALAAAGFGAVIPGVLNVDVDVGTGLIIRATGAVGLFVIVYFFNPAKLVQQEQPTTTVPEPPSPPEDIAVSIPSPHPVEDSVVPVGTEILLDLSHGQEEWRGLTAWAAKAENPSVRTSKQPYLENLGVLIFPLPFKQLLADDEITTIKSWVERGGGLLIMGYYAADTHHGTIISSLTREWGISFNDDLLMPPNASERDARAHVFGSKEQHGVRITIDPESTHAILQSVSTIVVVSGASINTSYPTLPVEPVIQTPADTERWQPEGPLDRDGMRPIIERWSKVGALVAPILATFEVGRGKVAICSSWKLATLPYGDNEKLMSNLIEWLRPENP